MSRGRLVLESWRECDFLGFPPRAEWRSSSSCSRRSSLLCSVSPYAACRLLAAIGSFGGAARDWSAARQDAADSLRDYVKTGRAADLARFDEALAEPGPLQPGSPRDRPHEALDRRHRDRAARGGRPRPRRLDHGAGRALGALPSRLRARDGVVGGVRPSGRPAERRPRTICATGASASSRCRSRSVLARIDRHDRLLQQVSDDFAASLSDSSRWLHDRLAAAEMAATVLLLSTGVSLARGPGRPRQKVGAGARRQRSALPGAGDAGRGRHLAAQPRRSGAVRQSRAAAHVRRRSVGGAATLGALLHRREPGGDPSASRRSSSTASPPPSKSRSSPPVAATPCASSSRDRR